MTSKETLEKLINKTGIIDDTCAHLLTCVKCGKCKFEEPIETCADYQLVMTIEKELKVLEIIKKKEVNVNTLIHRILMVIDPLEFYNETVSEKLKLTQQEFDLLKEWLEDEK